MKKCLVCSLLVCVFLALESGCSRDNTAQEPETFEPPPAKGPGAVQGPAPGQEKVKNK